VYLYINETVIPQLEQFAIERANEAEANANKYTDEQIAILVEKIARLEELVDFKVDRRVVKCYNINGKRAIVPYDHGDGDICATMNTGAPSAPLPGTGPGDEFPFYPN